MLFTPWVLVPLLVLTCLSMAASAMIVLDRDTHPAMRFKRVVDSLGYIYTVGVVVKFMLLGPAFIRWHVSDFGFPIVLALLFARVALFVNRYEYKGKDNTTARKSVTEACYLIMLAPLAVLASIGYELLVSYSLNQGTQNLQHVGYFDWVDVACYVAGGALIWCVAYRYNRTAGGLLRSHDGSNLAGLSQHYHLEVRPRGYKA